VASPQGDCREFGFFRTCDAVGESFELNIAAAQEAETLTKTAKSIILAQGSVRGKWNRGYSNTA
jgi:hypothetical protein